MRSGYIDCAGDEGGEGQRPLLHVMTGKLGGTVEVCGQG